MRRIARVNLRALAFNIRRQLESEPGAVLDARANAYGHGLLEVSTTALAEGFTKVLVSPGEAVPDGVPASAITRDTNDTSLVVAQPYGFNGTGVAVMTLCGEVIAVKPAPAGAGVSYGYTYRTSSATLLALVALGYADGIPWLASNRAQVFIGGEVRNIVGRVAMDQFVVDCGDYRPSIGDEVVVFGSPDDGYPTVDDWANHTRRSSSQITAGIGSRVMRVYS